MKPLVAPTYFMMLISLRRANTVRRMVLLMTTTLTKPSTATRMTHTRLTPLCTLVNIWLSCMGAPTEETPSMASSWGWISGRSLTSSSTTR